MLPDLDLFKEAFRRYAAGVSVITARSAAGEPVGFTATSLASLAAVPPLVTFNMALSATSWPTIAETDHVAIHLLGTEDVALASRMAANAAHRFLGEDWQEGPHGLPVFPATGVLIAQIEHRQPVHNNAVVVARVIDGTLGEQEAPLVYHERAFGSFRPLPN